MASWLVASFLLVATASCSDRTTPGVVTASKVEGRPATRPVAAPAWYDTASVEHDFGLVLAGSDVKRSHTYRISNTSGRPVRVRGVENRKPCCGEVAPVAPAVLAPGQSIEVAVTLHIGLAAGQVVHLAALATEGPSEPPALIRTTALARPRATVEESEPMATSPYPGESRRVGYAVRSFGTAANPPFPLDDRAIRSEAAIAWLGAASTRVDPVTGLTENRRDLALTVTASGDPGSRSTTLEVLDGGGVVARKWLLWEVARAIRATPPGLIVAADATDPLKVVLRSRDDRPFRILTATSRVEGLAIDPDGNTSAAGHTLAVRVDRGPRDAARSGEILIRTDHPGQPEVKVAAYLAARPGATTPKPDQEPSR